MSEQQPFEPQEPKQSSRLSSLLTPEVRQYLRTYRHTIINMAIGLLLSIGLFKMGFWKTLLVFCLMYGGYVLGGVQDRNARILYRIQRFYHHWIHNNPFMR